ncbi:hypothetical protein BV898_15926 [Hypsibius exemplaris]|uniref:N-alpha-acetyltransferase 60 n=1 Tax=Hypsibius exemplaris TaxID=2072580 RepID=A0A9X6NCJ5_HYPEX|nr:hypothetical protein BV898_15926 [Hypsibius exemplaris]
MEFHMSTPAPEHAEEIQAFCLEVFPASYDNNWYGYMLACDTVYKICYRHKGQLVALIVGQVARREAWNGVVQSSAESLLSEDPQKVTAYIMLLGVQENFRRCGLGSKLLISFMRTVNAAWPSVPRSFYLHVATENAAAIEMYRRHGFRRAQLLLNYYDYSRKSNDTAASGGAGASPPDYHDAFLYVKECRPAVGVEMLDSLWDCLACTATSAMTLAQKVISAVLVTPAQLIFHYTKNVLSLLPLPVQKSGFGPLKAQSATKVV